jgi:hypothetical protein
VQQFIGALRTKLIVISGYKPDVTSSYGPSRRVQRLTISVAIGAQRTSQGRLLVPAGRECPLTSFSPVCSLPLL